MLNIEIHSNENYLLITKTGVISVTDAMELVKSVKQHPDFCPDANRLYDLSGSVINWGLDDINQLILDTKETFGRTKNPLKIAFVNSDSTEQALLNLFVSLAKYKLERNFKLFSNLKSAQEWITQHSHH